MTKKSKDRFITILIVMAVLQGPFFYYFTEGFIKLILLLPFALTGLILSIVFLIKLIRYRSTNSPYHIIGLISACVLGCLTLNGSIMEKIDFHLQKDYRLGIIEKLKNSGGIIKEGDPLYRKIRTLSIKKDTVYIEFYIDRGFIDHYSAFLYTNDPKEIKILEEGEDMPFVSRVEKIERNWYRVSY